MIDYTDANSQDHSYINIIKRKYISSHHTNDVAIQCPCTGNVAYTLHTNDTCAQSQFHSQGDILECTTIILCHQICKDDQCSNLGDKNKEDQ